MMHLGLFIAGEGHHIAAWRDPASPDIVANQDIGHYIELAQKGERALFDFLFTADTNAGTDGGPGPGRVLRVSG